MIEIKAKKAVGFINKTIGLVNSNNITPLFIKTRLGIHTFGVKYSIDVVILDNQQKAVKIVKSLSQNRILLWNPIYNKVLELPEGTVKKRKIKLGSKIKILTV